MTASNARFESGGLTITVDNSGPAATVEWLGVSDAREPSLQLSPFFASLLDQLATRPVTVDFRRFEYMNSATVSPIISFVKSLDARGARTTLLFDVSVPWQKVNAQCMRAIARTLSNVQVP
jgi:hypothetical protein